MTNRNESSGTVSAPVADIGCRKAQGLMSPFIDSMARNVEVERLEAHLERCETCQRQLQAYVSVKNLLRSVEGPPVPEDLALETRVRLSHERVPSGLRQVFTRTEVWASNVIRPFAVPAIAGICSTLLLFGFVLDNIGAFRSAQMTEMTLSWIDRSKPAELIEAVWVEVHIDEDGTVPHYGILSGPGGNPVVDSWLENLLHDAVFKPATLAGRPIHSSLIMSFPGISIGVGIS
jgi:hypothetical protein